MTLNSKLPQTAVLWSVVLLTITFMCVIPLAVVFRVERVEQATVQLYDGFLTSRNVLHKNRVVGSEKIPRLMLEREYARLRQSTFEETEAEVLHSMSARDNAEDNVRKAYQAQLMLARELFLLAEEHKRRMLEDLGQVGREKLEAVLNEYQAELHATVQKILYMISQSSTENAERRVHQGNITERSDRHS
jgi:hypothetical protein